MWRTIKQGRGNTRLRKATVDVLPESGAIISIWADADNLAINYLQEPRLIKKGQTPRGKGRMEGTERGEGESISEERTV